MGRDSTRGAGAGWWPGARGALIEGAYTPLLPVLNAVTPTGWGAGGGKACDGVDARQSSSRHAPLHDFTRGVRS